ncbi:MAG: hypothetical protein WCD27_12945 [Candidatus Acidiferrales bacterium]
MDRRKFLQNLAVTSAAYGYLSPVSNNTSGAEFPEPAGQNSSGTASPDVQGYTLVSQFQHGSAEWKVYEDLRTRDGSLVYVSSAGMSRVLAKTVEATFPESEPPYLGLALKDIGMADADLLAERLLEHGGDPDPERVKAAAPPVGSLADTNAQWGRMPWNTFVGTKECSDTMPVFASGNTRTYHPGQYFPELNARPPLKRFEGLLGGWMPAVRKVMPVADGAYIEVIVFGDVQAHDRFIVQTWHRTARIESGKVTKVVYGYSYPDFPPRREAPPAEDFYRGLLIFADYWDQQLRDCANVALPDGAWADMTRHCFARELVVRPGGVYPKYGAVDRDYYGSEYDGFQDIFTSALYTNLEWGRFETARAILDNYLTDFTDAKGMINMRGPETAQFGMTLSLLARYFQYTGDSTLPSKHRSKIEATASMLIAMHDESLRLPHDDPGYGIIHGWSESDSCLHPAPMTWWLPYYANNAFAARGLKDISRVWPAMIGAAGPGGAQGSADDWAKRGKVLQDTVVASLRKNIRHDMAPPYVGPFPGTKLTFRESLQKEHPSPQGWAHRAYTELLQADMLPPELAAIVIDCMRAYGGTTLGIVANIEPPHAEGRDILGFISYGYAQMLLRLDRVEEFLLFLYAHRYHDHTRGSWTAGEVAGIEGDTTLFCIPAQQTIPLLVRWMLLLENSDEEILYFAKGVPREWLASGKEIRITQAPTRWGRVNFKMAANPETKTLTAAVELARGASPKEIQVKVRLPAHSAIQTVSVNGRPATVSGPQKDTLAIPTRGEKHFEISGQYS